MEGFIAKKQTCKHLQTSPPSLAIHRDSHSISKANNYSKPKIRIIHIFAPEIIKTDVANFRELVQRLTGKPTEKDCKKAAANNKPRIPSARREEDHNDDDDRDQRRENKAFPSKPLAKRMDNIHGFLGLDGIDVRDQRVIKEEDQDDQDDQEEEEGGVGMWNINGNNTINNSSGGFLERFADWEGFIEEINSGEFPLLPSLLNPNLDANPHVQYGFGLGGPQLA